MSTLERVTDLELALERDLERGVADRDSGQEDGVLGAAVRRVRAARAELEQGRPDAAEAALAVLAHQVGDSWPYTSAIAKEVLACHQALRRRR